MKKLIIKGKAIGCLYCLVCKRYGWGKNKCHWCGSTNVEVYSEKCNVLVAKGFA
ncbi:hypothetical protein ES705_37268 [subsurface metagenome]